MSDTMVETDVLVIGGGLAGCFAAIKAKEQGVAVTLVDKGYVGKSGSSAYPDTYAVFHPAWGHKLDEWMDQVNRGGEYLNNRVWTELVFKESYARYQDLVSWGVSFFKEDGELRKFRWDPLAASECLLFGGKYEAGGRRETAQILRKHAAKSGVTILDRVMVTDLMKQDGRIVGAIGIPMDNDDRYIFKAKATVISTGAAGFKPDGWPIAELTGDGMAMAYRAGAELLGNEFVDTHDIRTDYPASRRMNRITYVGQRGLTPIRPKMGRARRFINAEGDEITDFLPDGRRSRALGIEFEAHAGRGPLFIEIDADTATQYGGGRKIPHVGCATGGMATHTTEGVWPINTNCATSLPGLYAAGDSCGTMQVGAVYCTLGVAAAGATVTGTRAGLGAAGYASEVETPTVDEAELARVKKIAHAPLERRGGFNPRWVTQVLQNITRPYFILYVKHGKRLQSALNLAEFLRDHLVPKLYATDPHELRLAHETRNMVLNAVIKLKVSLFRTESRGWHYREDYPRRDDPAWLAWVKVKEKQGRMEVWKESIPKEWWPDLAKPYDERYPVRFPGEKVGRELR